MPTCARAHGALDDLTFIVLFSGAGAHWWSGVLRRGFRHCQVLVRRDDRWLFVNAASTGLVARTVAGVEGALLAGLYARMGFLVVVGVHPARPRTGRQTPGIPGRKLTCVAVAKRVLRLSAPQVRTPYQLFQRLIAGGASVWHPARAEGRTDVAPT